MTRELSDIQIDRMRERKFRELIKYLLVGSGLRVTTAPGGILIEWPNGEKCFASISNRTGTRHE